MVFDAVAFRQSVLEVVASVPRGKVVSYGLVARLAGWPNHSRMVGRVLHGLSGCGFPCHRIVNNAGRTAPCWPEQVVLLKSEGILFRPNGCVDMNACAWRVEEMESVDDEL